MQQLSPGGRKPNVAVVGAGAIGRAFAVLFASAGFPTWLQEPDAAQRDAARAHISATLDDLQRHGLLGISPEEALSRISLTADLGEAVGDAAYVQECAPEREEVKRALFAQLDALAPADAVLASSSSAMPASRFASGLAGAARCLVAHPGNPPFLLRVIEMVPAPFTAPAALDAATAIVTAAGLEPVLVRREVEGFVFNRLQGAVLREAYCLVRDGVASVADIDRIMRDGLGLRWSVVGPFETVDLNTAGGIGAHARRLGAAYARMGAERGQDDPWTEDLVAAVEAQRRQELPLEDRDARIAWRDRQLMALLALRRQTAEPQRPVEAASRPFSWHAL
jgi:3-hydroxyacyl-CoA dehydrogenase